MKAAPKSTAPETAQYIGGMARELRSMATSADLGFLAYLLSMVEQEAGTALNGEKKSGASFG